MAITKSELYAFIKACPLAVASTVSPDGGPEAALVNVAVTPDLELVFDTIDSTRKCTNLRREPRIAFVMGWNDMRTLQYEGWADEPEGNQLDELKRVYFEAHSDGESRQHWPGLTYFRVRPTWVRFSNYYRPRDIEEMVLSQDVPQKRTTGWWRNLKRS